MNLGRRRWILLAALTAVSVGALFAVSWVVMTYERHTLDTRRFNDLQRELDESTWRADAAIAPLLATESARPDEHYEAFYITDQALTREGEPLPGGKILVPSPLLVKPDRYAILHFAWNEASGWTSPQLPAPEFHRDAIERGWTDAASIERAALLLRDLADPDLATFLMERLSPSRVEGSSGPIAAVVPPGRDQQGRLRLLLARRSGDEPAGIQGVWFDWPALRQRLRNATHFDERELRLELLEQPRGEIEPGTSRMANLPVLLKLNAVPPPPPGWSTTRRVLTLAWIGFLATVGATVVALWTAWELSARRGRFASAVTHELRTPLTTFCMYSQMLADGVVSTDEARADYHRTLVTEAERLRRVVDNVLTHSRIEGRRAGLARERVPLRALLDVILPRLEERALEGGLCFDATDPRSIAPEVELVTDRQAVEQILMNLVDNSVKYGASGADPELKIELQVSDRAVRVRVSDNGPGIPRDISRRLFEPYARSERAVESRAPGVGLGLALARGLARELGGDLRRLPADVGASFELRLPRAS
ncbi:sensor histidine kinase [Engelhardtia mirabilis]|uniref:histidine kinase n=1 Tax=Engelhardtia mirabilis TaxID=2528011 RepID=A0A518BLG8_9BACT|nr:Sensor histidine kinase YycG [Planctomycetes bacterium Pla133]QDV02145.1 Sensor histidine kinase YycG [Planctomycetes bacterium Pla86]